MRAKESQTERQKKTKRCKSIFKRHSDETMTNSTKGAELKKMTPERGLTSQCPFNPVIIFNPFAL